MREVVLIAQDVIREAFARRLLQTIFVLILVWLGLLLFALNLDAVKGTLTAVKIFGQDLQLDAGIDAASMTNSFNEVIHYIVFHTGIIASIVLSSSIAPQLFAPGRVEFLLALPIRRWQLLMGTFLGVLVIVTAGNVLAIAGTALCLYVKTGFFPASPAYSIGIATFCFATIYAAMLLATIIKRSTLVAISVGQAVYFLGLITAAKATIVAAIDNSVVAKIVQVLLSGAPRYSELAQYTSDVPFSERATAAGVTLLFGVVLLGAAHTILSGKDY